MFAFGGRRRGGVAATALLVVLVMAGCASGSTPSPSGSAAGQPVAPRPADGNCTYVSTGAAGDFLGHAVRPRAVDALATDVDRCHYDGGGAELDYAVSYFGDVAGAAQQFSTLGASGPSAGLGDESVVQQSDDGATVAFRSGPFVVTDEVAGSVESPAEVAQRVARDILAHLG